jgi:hypothetical protein
MTTEERAAVDALCEAVEKMLASSAACGRLVLGGESLEQTLAAVRALPALPAVERDAVKMWGSDDWRTTGVFSSRHSAHFCHPVTVTEGHDYE